MASTLHLDMSDPAIAEMVGNWADNADYTLKVTIRTGSGDQRNVAAVVGPVEQEEEEETEMESEGAGQPPGPAAVKQAMQRSRMAGGGPPPGA